jgi:hypothetical protein
VRSERIKNILLSKIPELQWAGVNTYGCLAIISVRERAIPDKKENESYVGNIVAMQDGVISEITVLKGTPLCRSGQAVTKEQTLVSGYVDGGFVLRAEMAVAEILAITERTISAFTIGKSIRRGNIMDVHTDYSIQIGKNVVKLSRGSGIPDSSCAKICERKCVTLPGGFQLPVAMIFEKTIKYSESESPSWMDESELKILTEGYLKSIMLTGRVLASSYCPIADNGGTSIRGTYICEEQIGKLRKEGI